MYCPKCGQITINLNGKEVCTNCGIVFDDLMPKEQVLSQISAKAKAKNAIFEPVEEYISPVGQVAQRKQKPVSRPAEPFEKKIPPASTITEIQKHLNNPTMTISEARLAPASSAGSSIQRVMPEPIELKSQRIDSTLVPNPENISVLSTTNQTNTTPPIPASPQPQQNIYENNSLESIVTQGVYPSHEVNPILIKTLIGVSVLTIVGIGSLLLYSHLTFLRDTVDNMIKGVGMGFFK